ncbi:hypothetical protein AAHE18_02G185100 [Arachis hypogaea]
MPTIGITDISPSLVSSNNNFTMVSLSLSLPTNISDFLTSEVDEILPDMFFAAIFSRPRISLCFAISSSLAMTSSILVITISLSCELKIRKLPGSFLLAALVHTSSNKSSAS